MMAVISVSVCPSINRIEVLPDLSQTHRRVCEYLVLRNLLLDNLSEDDLERDAQAAVLHVRLKLKRLFLPLPDDFLRVFNYRNL